MPSEVIEAPLTYSEAHQGHCRMLKVGEDGCIKSSDQCLKKDICKRWALNAMLTVGR